MNPNHYHPHQLSNPPIRNQYNTISSPSLSHVLRQGSNHHKYHQQSPKNTNQQFKYGQNQNNPVSPHKIQQNNINQWTTNPYYKPKQNNQNINQNFNTQPNTILSPPNSRKPSIPKVVFIYHQGDREQSKNSVNSKLQTPLLNHLNQNVNQFMISQKIKKSIKNRLCSDIYNYYYIPVSKILKQQHQTQIKINQQKYSNCSKNSCKSHEQNQHQKSSKIASTVATRSFQASGIQKRSNNDFSSKKGGLLSQLSPSKLLKKTMMASKNEFTNIISISDKKDDKSDHERKWKSQVKNLFQQQQDNLKQSIHYGPDIRKQQQNLQLLGKLGRFIAQSSIEQHSP